MGFVVGAITFTGRFFITIILAANVLLLLFIVFSGAIDSRPINKLYWLQADTSDINQAPSVARWTYWGVCERQSDKNVGCSIMKPATPISPLDNFGYSDLLPDDFVTNRDTYFYLSRFAFAFFWVALSFLGIALVFYIFTWCSYSFTKVVFTLILIGALFDLGAVACQTAVTVIARNKFKSDDRSAKLGTALMCIAWASVACSILSFFGTGTSFIHRAWVAHKEYVDMQNYKEQALQYQNKGVDQPIVYDTNGDLESSGLGSGEPLPVAGGASEPQRHQSGVKFFKIRRAKHQGDVDSI